MSGGFVDMTDSWTRTDDLTSSRKVDFDLLSRPSPKRNQGNSGM